jgi:diacylglycerol kinase family enzyme
MGRMAYPVGGGRLPDAVGGFLIVNPRSGDDRPSGEELAAEAERRGIQVHLLAGEDDPAESASSASADVLGIAGGDGSLAPVAEVAVERRLPFVCIPFGTRNHFARDLGLDRDDPIGCLDAFTGEERRIDLGRVGERAFLNNVSLGDYAQLVHRREHHRRRSVALAGARALLVLLRHRRPLNVRIDGRPVSARIVLAANNEYELDLFSIGERERIDEGRLYLYVAAGWVPSEWEQRASDRFTLEADGAVIAAAVDGEPVELRAPLEFSIEPRALRVLLPPG